MTGRGLNRTSFGKKPNTKPKKVQQSLRIQNFINALRRKEKHLIFISVICLFRQIEDFYVQQSAGIPQ